MNLHDNELHYAQGVFLGLEAPYSDLATARYVVLPIPYDATACYHKGTANGPAAIIAASPHMEWFDEELKLEFHLPGIATVAAVDPADTPEQEMQRIYERAAALYALSAGGGEGGGPITNISSSYLKSAYKKFVIGLGGEHSVTAPLVRAAIEAHGPLAVLHVDAHADLRDSYTGGRCSHASVMARVLEMTDRICQVGVRSFSAEEYAAHGNLIDSRITTAQVRSDPRWLDRVVETLGGLDAKVYLTIDIDGLDPAIAPGTGTPEPGGLSWQEICSLVERVCRDCELVAADIVEVMPLPGNTITEFLAARLAAKIIAHHFFN